VVSRINVPLSNLRAVVIVIVVAFHSVLPYLASQPARPFPFDAPPYRWIAFPIIDQQRWFGFDLVCAWQDVSLMSLMFLLAGLFAPTSLHRKGTRAYVSDRWWRVGLPFLVAVGVLSPLAYFASYRATATDPSAAAFWQHWKALPMWPSGPAWFLWQVFFLSALAAGLGALSPRSISWLGNLAGTFSDRPLAFCLGLTALSSLAYVPLAMMFGAWDWTFLGPFSFQLSRPLHYCIYFLAGFAIGSHGCESGVLRSEGLLVRRWPAWLAVAVLSFALWCGLTSLTLPDWATSPLGSRLAAALVFPFACSAGAICLFAMCSQLMRSRHRPLDSLSAHAYNIYLIHYVPVVWLQYVLLGGSLDALEKGATVFVLALALSWALSAGLAALLSRAFDMVGQRVMTNQPQ
jgi:hypothetical protein